jgi:hypothetical protein
MAPSTSTYDFASDAGHKVTLAAAADGTVIADAVLPVGSGAPPPNLLYIHAGQKENGSELNSSECAYSPAIYLARGNPAALDRS